MCFLTAVAAGYMGAAPTNPTPTSLPSVSASASASVSVSVSASYSPTPSTVVETADPGYGTTTPMPTDEPDVSTQPGTSTSATPTPAPNQCQVEFMPWDVLFAGGTKTVVEDGSLQATVEHYSVGDCPTFYYAPTGGNVGGRTALSYNISMASESGGEPDMCCQLRTDGGVSEFVSFQAIVVKTTGWTMQPRGLRIMDVDAHQAEDRKSVV